MQRTMFLHDAEELDDNFGAWSDQTLTLASLLGIVDALEGVIEDRGSDHGGGLWGLRFSSRVNKDLRYLQRIDR